MVRLGRTLQLSSKNKPQALCNSSRLYAPIVLLYWPVFGRYAYCDGVAVAKLPIRPTSSAYKFSALAWLVEDPKGSDPAEPIVNALTAGSVELSERPRTS